MREDKFKVGDCVFYPYRGMGTVIANYNADRPFPVEVKWFHSSGDPADYHVSIFTKEGVPAVPLTTDENIVLEHIPQKSMSDDEENEGDEEENIVDDAINPSHYKVEGLPEAIDIMNHLMTPEQFEGFLWGNIMKYAYRFGRKGDKGETAGKIAWYANQLKAVEDWMKENET